MLMTFLIEVGTVVAVCYLVVWGIILGVGLLTAVCRPDGLLTYDPDEDGPRLPIPTACTPDRAKAALLLGGAVVAAVVIFFLCRAITPMPG